MSRAWHPFFPFRIWEAFVDNPWSHSNNKNVSHIENFKASKLTEWPNTYLKCHIRHNSVIRVFFSPIPIQYLHFSSERNEGENWEIIHISNSTLQSSWSPNKYKNYPICSSIPHQISMPRLQPFSSTAHTYFLLPATETFC